MYYVSISTICALLDKKFMSASIFYFTNEVPSSKAIFSTMSLQLQINSFFFYVDQYKDNISKFKLIFRQ